MIHLFLFDVDGVLVDPQGYLKALQDTVAFFSRRMGVGEHPPTLLEVRTFEANGLTSEWNSGAACVATLLVERLRRGGGLDLPPHWPDALEVLAANPLAIPHPDYAALAARMGERVAQGEDPTQAAYAVLLEEARTVAHVDALPVLLGTLLGAVHDFHQAPVTRYFQHLVIGSAAIPQVYGVPADQAAPAYLRQYDGPLLASDTRRQLFQVVESGRVRVALYTARPSLPPVDSDEPNVAGYSPEAEMARALVGLEAWPLIGLGRMRWLAQQSGENMDGLVKPSAVQALAAVGAAWSGQEAASLEAALALYRGGKLRPPLSELDAVTVHTFEDSVSGLVAVAKGVEMIQAAGKEIAWRPYGIAPDPASRGDPKVVALEARDVPVYASVNVAVKEALTSIQ